MAYPEFDGFSLQDDNYITEDVEYRTIPSRAIDYQKISRKSGVKLLSDDFAERRVKLRGKILGSSIADLKDKIDAVHTNVTRKSSGVLVMEADRTCTAILASFSIGDPYYSQDMVPFDLEFLLADPFFYAAQQTVNITIASGTTTETTNITISGTVYAEPSIIYNSPSGSGQTTVSGISVEYKTTGETITWSGTGATAELAYSNSVTFDYDNQLILEGTTEADIEGVFARWEPGAHTFEVTFSGTANGGNLEFNYQPRYL